MDANGAFFENAHGSSPLLARGGNWGPPRPKTVSRVLVTRKCAGFGPQNLDFGLSEARLRRKCAPGWAGADSRHQGFSNMAKAVTIKVKLVSTADTGFY